MLAAVESSGVNVSRFQVGNINMRAGKKIARKVQIIVDSL